MFIYSLSKTHFWAGYGLITLCVVFSSLAGKAEDAGELTEKEIIRAERNAGYISSRLREIQVSSKVLIM